jgi:integrating conjugative element membrane protein (TIGR03747 family)
MAENTQNKTTNDRQPERRQGLIGFLLSIPFKVLGVLLGALVLSLALEYIGLAFFWRADGWHHSQITFNTELTWLSDNFRNSLIFQEPGKTIVWLLELCYEWCFIKTGFLAYTQQAHNNIHVPGMPGYLAQIYLLIEDYVLASVYVILTFVVRLLVLVLTIPLFAMAFIVGGTDGLVRRDLRRVGAGRESAFIYHRAKRLVVPLIIAPWVIYLAIPITTNPILILIPCAVALGLAVMVTTATFKKYL